VPHARVPASAFRGTSSRDRTVARVHGEHGAHLMARPGYLWWGPVSGLTKRGHMKAMATSARTGVGPQVPLRSLLRVSATCLQLAEPSHARILSAGRRRHAEWSGALAPID